jgi:hypothetical protein
VLPSVQLLVLTRFWILLNGVLVCLQLRDLVASMIKPVPTDRPDIQSVYLVAKQACASIVKKQPTAAAMSAASASAAAPSPSSIFLSRTLTPPTPPPHAGASPALANKSLRPNAPVTLPSTQPPPQQPASKPAHGGGMDVTD